MISGVSGPKFTKFFFVHATGIAVDNAIYSLSISLSTPEIFTVKFKSCWKAYEILDVFLPSQILREWCPQKLYPGCHRHLAAHQMAQFHKATPLGYKDLATNTPHFKPIFDPL